MRAHLVGRGIVARRVERMLGDRIDVFSHDSRWPDVSATSPGDVVVLAHGGAHAATTSRLAERDLHVVTVGDSLEDTRSLLEARLTAGPTVVVGAALSPGLSGLIARHLANQLDAVDEIHVAIHGTAGPACAREYHRSLSGLSPAWHDGTWTDRVGGSGRELCWFPEPIGAKDCYRARMAAPLILHESFPEVRRISARRSARRRDRFTAWLPMLAPPHPEGGTGGLRVEVRGSDEGGRQCLVAGVAELVGTASAATAAAMVLAVVDDLLPPGLVIPSDAALPTADLLRRIERFGIRLQEFTGVPQT